jgi:HAD superfamily hydrolase (TIGR01509 family)
LIRTIFFDFGNVVAMFDHGRAVAKLAAFTDMPPIELALALYGNPLEDAYERGRISTEEYVRLAKLAGRLECAEKKFLTAFVDIFRLNPEICEWIPKLAEEHRLILASNTNEAHFKKFTKQFAEVLGYFSVLCPSHQAGYRKPEPEYFEYCQRFAEAQPGECLFVDDLPANIEGAVRHGWQGMLYRPGSDFALQLTELGIQFERVNS